MMEISEIDLARLDAALASLKEAVAREVSNDLERDGAIQRFEYTFEMSWKTIRRFLRALGRNEVSGSPKPVLRDAIEENLIRDVEKWFEFLEARNRSSHIYSEAEALRVYALAKAFPPYVDSLLNELRRRRGDG